LTGNGNNADLVSAKNKQGYGTTLVELWAQCRLMNIPLPQREPVAASAFCNARKKRDETLFKTLNTEILKNDGLHLEDNDWNHHRLFAVDGSKVERVSTTHPGEAGLSTSFPHTTRKAYCVVFID